MKKILIILIIGLFALLNTDSVEAQVCVAEGSAQIEINNQIYSDGRAIILKTFLEKQKSPLSDYAEEMVFWADKNSLDWRLVPAITGVESSFGKRIPQNSYNAYGWANGEYSFTSWEESIEVVSTTLRKNYLDRGATSINQIARRYAPPSNTWAGKVKYFMAKIDPLPLPYSI